MTLPRYCTECPDYSSFGHCGATADFLPLPDPSGVTRPPLWCPKREADDAVVSSDGRVHLPVLKPTPELVPQTDDEAEALVQTVFADMARREGAKPTLLDLERERGSRWAEYQYDHRLANCEACPLKGQRDTMVLAQRPEKPENFNRLMIIGESPSPTDVSQRRPLAGLDGQLLDQLLAMSGVNRSRSYITQTVLCRPEEGTKLSDVYEAVEACRPRLLSEIAYVKPRVVVGLGGAALDAITGIDQRTTKKAKLPCPVDTSRGYESPSCEGRGMKKRKAYACAKCKLIFRGVSAETIGDRKPTPPDMSPCEFATSTGVGCGAKEPPKKAPAWQPRSIVCLTCDGKKQQVVEIHSFKSAFSLGGNKPVAGAVFAPEKLASEAARGAFHPASYFIPTYHPYLLRRPPKTKGEKQIGGQFLASAAVLHLRKAVRLLTQEPNFKLDWVKFYDSEAADFRAWLEANPGPYSVDLETNAKEIDEVTVIKCAGIDSHVTSKTAVLVLAGLERSSALVTAFLELLASPTIGKVWQNGFSYDYPVLRRVYGVNDAPGYIGDVLVRHSAIYPDEPHNLQHIGFEYADAPAWKPTDKKRNPADAPIDDELLEYCATDVRMTTLSFKAMEADLDREKVRVVEEMDTRKMHMGLAMERAGLPIDRRAQLEVGARCRFEAEQALGFMRMYIDERGGVPIALLPEKREEHGALFNPDSNPQLQWALFDNVGPCKLRPMAFTDSGAPSAAEEGLVKYKDHPFVNALFEYRKSTKTVSTYIEGIVIGPDGRLHARWNPVGARSGRYSTSPNCFDAETEVLTPEGWLRMDDFCTLPTAPQVMQATPTREGVRFDWAVPTDRIVQEGRELLAVQSEQIDLCTTADHRLLFQTRKGAWEERTMGDWREDRKLFHAGTFGHTPRQALPALLVQDFHRLVVATQADGSYTDGHQIVFRFDKKRKIARMRALLAELKAEHTEHVSADARARTIFTLRGEIVQAVKRVIPEKRFTWAWFQQVLQSGCVEPVAAELFHWDGCFDRDSMYATAQKENADIAQALVTLSGRRVKLREYIPANSNAQVSYQLDVSNRAYSWTTHHAPVPVSGKHTVYCLSVPSSYVLVRRRGKVAVVGQCQNWAKWLRAMIVAPAGRAFIGADFDQLELRILAAASGDKNLILRCKGADDKRKLEPEWDPHSYVASLALGPTFTSLDLNDPKHDKKNPRCACQTCRRKALRDGTKATVYGLNYGAGAEKILEQIITRALKSGGDLPPVDQNTVEITIDAYFSAFPDVKKFRDESLRFAERTGYLREAMFGRIRIFPLKEVPPTEASNFGIQALAASVMDWGAWNVHARIEQEVQGAAVIAQIHDALYAEASIEDAPRVAEIMNTELPCEVRVAGSSEWMPLTASAVIGPTLKDVG